MILAVVGATAVGKSALAVAVATELRSGGGAAEIVNGDSMLLYRGMDIGTAKPSPNERAEVPHHLVDVLEVDQTSTVAEFQTLARAAIAGCLERGVLPILVGGSALYVRAVLDRFEFPGTDPRLRAELEEELSRHGAEALHRRLAALDSDAAAAIGPGNGRRVVRALEVVMLTGRPFRASLPERRYVLPGVVQVGLAIDRPTLDARIAARVDAMWQDGFVDEVRLLAGSGLREGRTASRALGYRQVLDALDGRISEEEARLRTVQATRRFARRQEAWFRRDPRITWLCYDRVDLVAATLGALAAGELAGPPVED